MLQVSIVDLTAEERLNTISWFEESLQHGVEGAEFLPRMAFKPLSVSELKFQSVPDLVVIGPGLASGAANELARIRELVPAVPLIVLSDDPRLSLATIEYLARIGIEEVLQRQIQPRDLMRRLVMISSRIKRRGSGKLMVVDAAKGGVGATTVSAGLAELIAECGSRVLLIDADEERQSLSRFLQARPFINQAYQDLLTGVRPVTPDFVEQCLVQVWKDLPGLWCMSPGLPGTLEGVLSIQVTRILVAMLETLEQIFDFVIIDAGAARGTYRRILLRAADRLLFICDGDPASAFASFERIRKIREEISPDANIHLLENRRTRLKGLSHALLRGEFERCSGIHHKEWCSVALPYCARLARWPGSGMSAYGAGSRRFKRHLETIALEVGVMADVHPKTSLVSRLFPGWVCAISQILLQLRVPRLSEALQVEHARTNQEPLMRRIDWKHNHGAPSAEELLLTPPQPIQI